MLSSVTQRHRDNSPSRTPATEFDAGRKRRICLSFTSTGDDLSACSNKRRKVVFHLPEEIIFKILILLPAPILYNSMRFICRQWSRIISDPCFIREHLFHAPYLVFKQRRVYPPSFFSRHQCSAEVHYIDIGERAATIKPLNLRFPTTVLASYDGLVVFPDPKDKNIIYVANPVTKQRMTLPPLPLPTTPKTENFISLAPVTSAKEYKVICIYRVRYRPRIFVIPVGKDVTWKEIFSEHLLYFHNYGVMKPPLVTEGHFHWARDMDFELLSLDLKTETFHEFSAPMRYWCDFRHSPPLHGFPSYNTKKNDLCCVYKAELAWEIFSLKDPRSGEWRKLYRVNYRLNTKCFFFNNLVWVRHGEVVVHYSLGRSLFVYNVKTGSNYRVPQDFDTSCDYYPHVESLVSLPLP